MWKWSYPLLKVLVSSQHLRVQTIIFVIPLDLVCCWMLIWVNFFTTSCLCVLITTYCFFHMWQEYFQCSIMTFHSPKELLWEAAFLRFLIKWKDWAEAKKSIKLLILIHPKSLKYMYICMWKLLYYHCSRIVDINNASHCLTSILAGETPIPI